MARIDRERLDGAAFPVTLAVPTRYADLDVQGHVNNVAAVALLQEARATFNQSADLRRHLAGIRSLVAALAVDYAGELHHPGIVEIGTGVLAIGRTSVTLGQRAVQDGAPRLYARTVLVIADADGPTPIPPALRDLYARLSIA